MEEDSAMAAAAAAEVANRRRPRDLLRRFGSVSSCHEESANGADSDEIELGLGLGLSLSLGGCFGSVSNPNCKGKSKLARSSSVASFSPFAGDADSDFSAAASAAAVAAAAASSLARTCSLPTETEEERRKRKKVESLKRLEAKRKRLERRNSLKSAAAASGRERVDGLPPISQGSIGSQGSSPFSAADFEIKAANGNDSELKIQPLPENINHKIAAMPPAAPARTAANCNAGQQSPVRRTLSGRTDSLGKNIMEDMPCVSTTGDGPNGRRIEGFLFKFEKVEDLRIVCVCHGSFLTPAEFVKHAGGGDVAHPLKHIVVNPSPSSFS